MAEGAVGARSAESDWSASRALAYASFSPRLRNLYGSVRDLPLLGEMARGVVARLVPRGCRVWMQPRAGLAQGIWLNVDPRFEGSYVEGLYEPILQQVLAEHLREGGTFYDVGAHIGFFSLIAARLVGQRGAVFAFEADPQNAARIEQHAARGGFAHLQVQPQAVWSESAILHFQRASGASSRNTGSVVKTSAGQGATEIIEVKAVTLDEFTRGQRPPTLIKVDVEGGEADVLRGADRLFSTAQPSLICEIHHQQASDFAEAFLVQKGYALHWIDREADARRHLLAEPS